MLIHCRVQSDLRCDRRWGTCRNRHVVLRQDGHAHTEHHDYHVEAPAVWDFRVRVVVVWTAGLRSGPRTQRMSLTRCCSGSSRKFRIVWTVTSHLLAFLSCCQDDKIHWQSFGDQGGRECASVLASWTGHSISWHRIIRHSCKMGFPLESHVFKSASSLHTRRHRQGRWTSHPVEDDHLWLCCDSEGNVSGDRQGNTNSHDQGHSS